MATFSNEQLAFLESFDPENYCSICRFEAEGCKGGVRGSPNGPIYPPCCDGDPEDYIDLARLEQAMEEKE